MIGTNIIMSEDKSIQKGEFMFMSWTKHYERWMQKEDLEKELKSELLSIQQDKSALKEHFHTYLQFGTAGIRGILGPGTNRLNIYMIRKAAKGVATYILELGEEAKRAGVVIAYDNRRKSPEFAMEVAKTLGFHGIKSYVFESLRTTPELSFAVRHLGTTAGIMITASHNPPEYNGLKVYGKDGGQVTSEVGEAIVKKVNAVKDELDVEVADEEELKQLGLLEMIGESVDQAYLENLRTVIINKELVEEQGKELNIVYTPFHGTGLRPVTKGLEEAGFTNVTIVKEQAEPDEDFTHAKSPNPEEHSAFELAIEYGERTNADLLIGTDPDADRMGIAVRFPNGKYEVLTGNQIGAILLHYLLNEKKKQNEFPENGSMIKTIVTSELGQAIAEAHDVKTYDVLTGFKYISEIIESYDRTKEHEFLFGYEESYGYLIKTFARDKDAVQACLLAAEVAAYYKKRDMTLYDALMEIYETYGYYREDLKSLRLEGIDGAQRIQAILSELRENPLQEIAGKQVKVYEDYEASTRTFVESGKTETIDLPQSNVLKWKLADDAWVCARPSGTEPLIKFYFGVKENSLEESERLLSELVDYIMNLVNKS